LVDTWDEEEPRTRHMLIPAFIVVLLGVYVYCNLVQCLGDAVSLYPKLTRSSVGPGSLVDEWW
jgi:hypothetical protein